MGSVHLAQLVFAQPIVLQLLLRLCLRSGIDLTAHSDNAQRTTFHTVRDDLRSRLCELVLQEPVHVMIEDTLAHNHHRHHSGRNHRHNHNGGEKTVCAAFPPCRHELMFMETQQANAEISGEGNEHRVDEKQIERTQEVQQMSCRQPIAGAPISSRVRSGPHP